jgi:hypothetical protein
MLYVFLHIWPWILAAFVLGALTGIFAGRITAQSAPLAPKRTEPKKVVVKEPTPAAPPAQPQPVAPSVAPDRIEALEKQLAMRDASIADLRAGLEREVALRRAAIARLEGMMIDQQAQAPTRPLKAKASAKSSPSS